MNEEKQKELLNYKEIEQEFSRLLRDEKNRWVEMYRLIDKVEKLQIWRQAGERSFTAWVKNMAVKCNIHESVIWQKKKAGAVYTAYMERIEAKGGTALDPTHVTIPSESLELINKIAQNNVAVADDLINKSIAGTMTRDDLRQTWQTAKSDNNQSSSTARVSDKNQDDSSIAKAEDYSSTARVNAKDIITTLIASRGKWINPASLEQEGRRGRRKIGESSLKSKILTEFAVRTGSSRVARRIDAVCLENIGTGTVYDLVIHGIEIKISESDLKNDHKFTEYKNFVDCLWLAVPPELVELAKEIKPHGCGILSINNNGVAVADPAEIAHGIARVETMQTALIKLI